MKLESLFNNLFYEIHILLAGSSEQQEDHDCHYLSARGNHLLERGLRVSGKRTGPGARDSGPLTSLPPWLLRASASWSRVKIDWTRSTTVNTFNLQQHLFKQKSFLELTKANQGMAETLWLKWWGFPALPGSALIYSFISHPSVLREPLGVGKTSGHPCTSTSLRYWVTEIPPSSKSVTFVSALMLA